MAAAPASESLKWSSQLTVTPPSRTPSLPGDKILLPQSALEQLLAAAPVAVVQPQSSRSLTTSFDPFNPYTFSAEQQARELAADRQQQLPHPLTFRVVNPQNGRVVHAGIREFSAQDGEVALSSFLQTALGLEEEDLELKQRGTTDEHTEEEPDTEGETGENDSSGFQITVHAKELPKGTYVRLRPLEAGYDPEDWKALLERYLRDNFTTLTKGEILIVPGGRNEQFRFLVDKVQPDGDGICIVDTDLEVDIEALNEEQARETLKKRLEKATRAPGTKEGSSTGGKIDLGEEITGQILRSEYVDYELHEWERGKDLEVEMDVADDADVDMFISPFSSRQRARPRDDEHVFGEMSNRASKRIRLQSTNVELEDAEALYISVRAYADTDGRSSSEDPAPLSHYNLRVNSATTPEVDGETPVDEDTHDSDETQCKNCLQWLPQRTLFLHENFCLRNNVLCPHCNSVFMKRSPEWQNHWHCPHDSSYGNDPSSKMKHDNIYHTPHTCPSCNFEASNLPSLAQHRTSTCPGKLILCQFCHLIVPQREDSDPEILDPEVLLSGLTPHELVDGGRTTECHLCNKIVRLRDMKTHLRHHDLDRLARPPPRVCKNPNCGRTLEGGRNRQAIDTSNSTLGLCNVCFGPLYTDAYDPEGKALRRRIERRYLSQMLTGCGNEFCRNEYCKTGRKRYNDGVETTMSTKEILTIVKPLLDAITMGPSGTNTAPIYFCTDQTSQVRKMLANTLAAESSSAGEKGYGVEWCVAAIESAGGDINKARDWLKNWAPRTGEIAA